MSTFNYTTNESLLKATDIARILNISKALAYRLLQQGDIPTIRINKAIRVRPIDVEQFIQKCRSITNIEDKL